MTVVGPIDCVPVDPNSTQFKCCVCGAECPIAPPPPQGAVCEAHCPDHIYESFGSDGKRCRTCFAPMPDDWK